MNKPITGIVIPIIRKKYIFNLLEKLNNIIENNLYAICIVNDGNNKINDYLKEKIPQNIDLLNLKENLCFAGANNEGWKFLILKYPSIKYLGTINDDTIPFNKNWLQSLERILIDNNDVGACSPSMITYQGFFKKREKKYSTFKLYNKSKPMIVDKNQIESDTYVSVLAGFCILAKREILENINFFNQNYKNSCEDIDLSLKIRMKKYKLMVSFNTFIIHLGGKSRFKSNTNTNIQGSRTLLLKEWGENLEKYNL